MPNDLVIKLLGEDATSPAIRSATAGIGSYGNAVRSTMQKVSNETARARNSWMSFVDLTDKARAPSTSRLNDDTDGVAGMDRRQQAAERAAAMYEKSTGRMARALQKLNQDEIESAAVSTTSFRRRISSEERYYGLARSVSSDMSGAAHDIERGGMVAMQAAFALDDFFAGYQTGGLMGGMRGAANNISMIAMQLGGVEGMLAAIGVTASISLGAAVWKEFAGEAKKAKTPLEEINDQLSIMRMRSMSIDSPASRIRSIGELQDGMRSSSAASLMSQMNDVRFEGRQRVYNQEDYDYNVNLMERMVTAATQRLASTLSMNPYDDPNKLRSREVLDAQIMRQDLNDEQVASLKQYVDLLKEQRQLERESGQNQRDIIALTRQKIAIEKELPDARAREFQKEFRDETLRIARADREMKKLNEERDRFGNKQERFSLGLFGDTGREEGILSQMQMKLKTARELFTDGPQQLADAERLITGITEEKLARLKLDERGKSSPLRSPSLALFDSDRARQITLGAGNQARDASTRIDKHNSAMEKLTADIRDGIKEMVSEAKKDIELVIDIAEN